MVSLTLFMLLAPLAEGKHLFNLIPRLSKSNFFGNEDLFLMMGIRLVLVSGEL